MIINNKFIETIILFLIVTITQNAIAFNEWVSLKSIKKTLADPTIVIPASIGTYIVYKSIPWILMKSEFSRQSNTQLLISAKRLIQKTIRDYKEIYSYAINNNILKSVDVNLLSDITLKANENGYWIFPSYKYNEDLEKLIIKLSRLGAELKIRSLCDNFNQEEYQHCISSIEHLIPEIQLISEQVKHTAAYQSEFAKDTLIEAIKYTGLYLGSLFSLFCLFDSLYWFSRKS